MSLTRVMNAGSWVSSVVTALRYALTISSSFCAWPGSSLTAWTASRSGTAVTGAGGSRVSVAVCAAALGAGCVAAGAGAATSGAVLRSRFGSVVMQRASGESARTGGGLRQVSLTLQTMI